MPRYTVFVPSDQLDKFQRGEEIPLWTYYRWRLAIGNQLRWLSYQPNGAVTGGIACVTGIKFIGERAGRPRCWFCFKNVV